MKLNSIQSLRWLAATLVIVCHAYDPARIGAFGVDIFFVISGFIITRAMPHKSAGRFLRDRLLRIYPIYWICALPTALVAAFIGALTIPRTLTSITLWPVFDGFLQPYLVLGWTLSFEMLFYLAATLVLVNRRLGWALAVAYPLAMLLAFRTGAPLFRFIGNPLVVEFLLGVAIANLPARRERPWWGAAAALAAVAILSITDASRLYLPLHAFELTAPDRAIAWGVPAALIVWAALQFESRTKSWRLLPYLGDASYSIYLAHGTALFLYYILPWPLEVVGAVALGAAVYRYIEAPLSRALRGRPGRRDEKLSAVAVPGDPPAPVPRA